MSDFADIAGGLSRYRGHHLAAEAHTHLDCADIPGESEVIEYC